jgi:hypothetical protein
MQHIVERIARREYCVAGPLMPQGDSAAGLATPGAPLADLNLACGVTGNRPALALYNLYLRRALALTPADLVLYFGDRTVGASGSFSKPNFEIRSVFIYPLRQDAIENGSSTPR